MRGDDDGRARSVDPGEVTALWAVAQVTALVSGLPTGFHLPEYGTDRWVRLSPGDPGRAAALITAAEAWRRLGAERTRLDRLAEDDPDAWFAEVTAEADAHAARLGPVLARVMEARQRAARATFRPAVPVQAAAGWPVAVPGQPGWWRHLIGGRQVDLPARDVPVQHGEAA